MKQMDLSESDTDDESTRRKQSKSKGPSKDNLKCLNKIKKATEMLGTVRTKVKELIEAKQAQIVYD